MLPPKNTSLPVVPAATLALAWSAASLAGTPGPGARGEGAGAAAPGPEAVARASAEGPFDTKAGADTLPPAPQVLFQVGESCITSFALRREVNLGLRRELERRAKLRQAGRWGEADEARLAGLYARRAEVLKGVLVGRALVEELARENRQKPNGLLLEHRLRAQIRRAGGVERLLAQRGRTLDEVREELRAADLEQRFREGYVRQALDPGPRDIRGYFAANRERMRGPGRVKVRVIVISSGPPASGSAVARPEAGPDEKAAAEKADALRRELQYAPERFERLARESSDHEETAKLGGLVVLRGKEEEPEWLPIDELARLNPLVARVAARLKPGAVSDVVKADGGFLLVKLDGARPGEELRVEDAAERIAGIIKRRRDDAFLDDWIDYYLGRMYFVDGRGSKVDVRRPPGAEGRAP